MYYSKPVRATTSSDKKVHAERFLEKTENESEHLIGDTFPSYGDIF